MAENEIKSEGTTPEEIYAYWKDALQTIIKSDFETAKINKESIILDYWKIDKYNNKLTDYLIDEPKKAIIELQKAIHSFTNNGGLNVNIIFDGHPISQIQLSELRTKHLNKLHSLEGFVIETYIPKPRIVTACFRCRKCRFEIYVNQKDDSDKILEPMECPEEKGGCGRATNWEYMPDKSLLRDFQKIIIQNPYYEMQRVELEVHLYDDHCGIILPGDWITIHGIYSIKNPAVLNQVHEPYFLVRGIENSYYRSLDFTDDEKINAEKLSRSDELWPLLIKNFAPSVFGYYHIKEALLLQLFGGVWHDLPDGTNRRGSIHELFIGDPGTAKSIMKQGSSAIAPRFTAAAGTRASGPGLTAAAIPQKQAGQTSWKLQAGAMVLANTGICFIDEFDKLGKDDQGALHQPMEQGYVEVSMAGSVNQKLPARTSILANMNPKDGRITDKKNILNQTDVVIPLISRFDIIYAVRDKPDKDLDYKISKHMHKALKGEIIETDFNLEFMRKYIFNSHKIKPLISDEADDFLTDKFIECRINTSIDENGDFLKNITFRDKETLRRLSEASARSRYSKIVDKSDVERAWRVYRNSLYSIGVDDLDTIHTGWNDKLRKLSYEITSCLPCSYYDLRSRGFNEEDIKAIENKGIIKNIKGRYYRREDF